MGRSLGLLVAGGIAVLTISTVLFLLGVAFGDHFHRHGGHFDVDRHLYRFWERLPIQAQPLATVWAAAWPVSWTGLALRPQVGAASMRRANLLDQADVLIKAPFPGTGAGDAGVLLTLEVPPSSPS
jgi:hypothetical protein